MSKLLELGAKTLDLAKNYPKSLYGGLRNRKLFEGVEKYCMFIGYPRSGHSLIGSLLDAHPNIVIANELDVLKFIYARFSKRQIYYLLIENPRTWAESGRKSASYSYEVLNQWQGRFKKLQVIGDKKGWSSTLRLRSNPELLRRLQDTISLNIKFIHVIRNPYDLDHKIKATYKYESIGS